MNPNRKRTMKRKLYPHSTCIVFDRPCPRPLEIRRWCIDAELEGLIDTIKPNKVIKYYFGKQADLTLFLLKWGEYAGEYHE